MRRATKRIGSLVGYTLAISGGAIIYIDVGPTLHAEGHLQLRPFFATASRNGSQLLETSCNSADRRKLDPLASLTIGQLHAFQLFLVRTDLWS